MTVAWKVLSVYLQSADVRNLRQVYIQLVRVLDGFRALILSRER